MCQTGICKERLTAEGGAGESSGEEDEDKEEEEEDVDPAFAEMMGFGGFGGSKRT